MDAIATTVTHVAFADETHYNVGRYRGVATVTLAAHDLDAFRNELWSLLQASNISEFKWKKLTSAKTRFAANRLIDWTCEKAVSGSRLRVDVLVWDTTDKRHAVEGRDDIENMHIMYERLFKNVLKTRWPDDTLWALFPDENLAMKWKRLAYRLQKKTKERVFRIPLPLAQGDDSYVRTYYSVAQVQPCQSHAEPFVQLADFFAGIAVYSWASYQRYCEWKNRHLGRQVMPFLSDTIDLSSSDRERCSVLDHLNGSCKRHKLQVALDSTNGLETKNPKNPINFWPYRAQYEGDIAPTKRRE